MLDDHQVGRGTALDPNHIGLRLMRVGHIGNGNQKNQQSETQVAGNLLAQRHDVDTPVPVGIRVFLLQLGADSVHLGLCLRITSPGIEPGGHGHKTAHLFAVVERLREDKGRPHLGFAPVSEPSLMNHWKF